MNANTRKRLFGLILSAAVIAALWLAPIRGLASDAQRCLALTIGAIVLWMFEVVPSGFTALGLLIAYLLLLNGDTVAAGDVFRFWTQPMAYMVLGGFLIAGAVRESGLGKRLALLFIRHFVRSYSQIIISCYVISYALALIIPQCFPRAFLLMSIMGLVVESSGMEKKYAAQVGLAIFAAQNAASMMFMTGEGSLNTMIVSLLPAGSISWLQWLGWMCVPAVFTGAAMCFLQLRVYGRAEIRLDPQAAQRELDAMGKLTAAEKKVLFWLAVAVLLWMTNGLHGIDVGWITMGVAILMAMPVIGDIVNAGFLKEVNLNAMLFMTAALAIGVVGGKTGMSGFLTALFLPETLSGGVFAFILLTIAVCMGLHLCVGGILSVFALITPAMIALGAGVGLPAPLAGLAVYLITFGQWIFPFQNLTLALSVGEGKMNVTSGQLTRFGLLYTIPAILCVFLAFGWWKLLGLY